MRVKPMLKLSGVSGVSGQQKNTPDNHKATKQGRCGSLSGLSGQFSTPNVCACVRVLLNTPHSIGVVYRLETLFLTGQTGQRKKVTDFIKVKPVRSAFEVTGQPGHPGQHSRCVETDTVAGTPWNIPTAGNCTPGV